MSSIGNGCICKQKAVQFEEKVYSIRRAKSALGRQCVWCEEKVWSIKNVTSLQYEERNCAVPGGSHLQYEEKVVQCGECHIHCTRRKLWKCEERVYSIRRATSAVGGQGVWCEEKACKKRIVTSDV